LKKEKKMEIGKREKERILFGERARENHPNPRQQQGVKIRSRTAERRVRLEERILFVSPAK